MVILDCGDGRPWVLPVPPEKKISVLDVMANHDPARPAREILAYEGGGLAVRCGDQMLGRWPDDLIAEKARAILRGDPDVNRQQWAFALATYALARMAVDAEEEGRRK